MDAFDATASNACSTGVRPAVPGHVAVEMGAGEPIKELLRGRPGSSGERNRTNLGQVKLEVFKGDRAHYRNWLKTIQAQRQLYQLQDEELAVLMLISCEGELREVLNLFEIEDMRSAGGLNRVLRLLEDAYGAKADERFEEKQSEYRAAPIPQAAASQVVQAHGSSGSVQADPPHSLGGC